MFTFSLEGRGPMKTPKITARVAYGMMYGVAPCCRKRFSAWLRGIPRRETVHAKSCRYYRRPK